MKNNNTLVECLSLTLILSYFFVHKIILVFTGITLSIYMINIDHINGIIRSINKNVIKNNITIRSTKTNKAPEIDSNKRGLAKEDSKLTLVETIEELGYIPSKDRKEDSNAA